MFRLIAAVLLVAAVAVSVEARPSAAAPEERTVSCPEDIHDFILPHETDCDKFYKCSWGDPVLYRCPDGLWFDPDRDVCNWPDQVNCDNSGDNGGDNGSGDNGGDNGSGDNGGDSGESSGESSEESSESESSEESSSESESSEGSSSESDSSEEEGDETANDSNEAAEEENEKY